jgi:hypothetical protein
LTQGVASEVEVLDPATSTVLADCTGVPPLLTTPKLLYVSMNCFKRSAFQGFAA